MKKQQAINLAIDAIRGQIKRFVVDANLYDKGGADYPHAKKSSERRKQLLDAIEVLETMRHDP